MPEAMPANLSDGDVLPESWVDAVVNVLEDQDTGPGARVYHSANQVIPNATWTTVAFNAERYDTEGLHDTAVQNSRLTVPAGKGGVYVIWFNGDFVNTGTNNAEGARLRVNGVDVIASHRVNYAGYEQVMVMAVAALAAGSYVEAQVYHDTGGNNDLQASSAFSPDFGMHRLGPST